MKKYTLRIAGIMEESIVDGPGMRLVVFTQGCPRRCPGCHNPETHDPLGGREIDIDEIYNLASSNPLLSGVTFSGGEPFMQAGALAVLARRLRGDGLHVMSYTGYLFEDIPELDHGMELLGQLDVLVDGPFLEEEKSLELRFAGSRNQRAIDVGKTLDSGEIVLAWDVCEPSETSEFRP